jgi:ABC-2 type transport system ATP-binding protein
MNKLSSKACISLRKLTKQYSGTKTAALDSVSLDVHAGEVYGFLGPNGAGKSTAIKTLLNFIQPTSGSATINKLDIVKDSVEIKKHIGYLSGDFAIYPKMTGHQFLSYMGQLQPPKSKHYMQSLLRRLKAEPNKKLQDLSRGNRQKIGIIQAFMHQPDILILDEPTSGLDPLMQEEFYALLREAKDRGAAIFMSSHILSEVQKTCDRVGIIRNGKLVDEQSIDTLNTAAAQTLIITFFTRPPIAALKQLPNTHIRQSKQHNTVIVMCTESFLHYLRYLPSIKF